MSSVQFTPKVGFKDFAQQHTVRPLCTIKQQTIHTLLAGQRMIADQFSTSQPLFSHISWTTIINCFIIPGKEKHFQARLRADTRILVHSHFDESTGESVSARVGPVLPVSDTLPRGLFLTLDSGFSSSVQVTPGVGARRPIRARQCARRGAPPCRP